MRKQWLLVTFAAASLAHAGDDGSGKCAVHRGPPAEAVQACNGLQEGAACSFTHYEHQVSGTCRQGPQGEPAACFPNGPPHGHFGPPPEALEACTGLEVGATCSFTHNGKQIGGTCHQGPQGKPAMCLPTHPPSPS